MAKFDAALEVEAMEWDFTKPLKDKKAKGTIPEPSTGQVEAFFNDTRKLITSIREEIKERTGIDVGNLEAVKEKDVKEETIKALETMSDSMLSDQQEALSGVIAKVCSDQPSAEQLQALPYRVFMAFNKWLAGELRPNQQAADTKN